MTTPDDPVVPPAADPAAPAPTGPEVVLPDAETAAAAAAVEGHTPVAAPVRVGTSFLWAFAFAIIGAVIWAVVTHVTDYELGIVAIVVGILAGAGAARGGRGRGPQVIGALAGGFGYFLGQMLIMWFIFASKPFIPGAPPAVHHHGAAPPPAVAAAPTAPPTQAGLVPPVHPIRPHNDPVVWALHKNVVFFLIISVFAIVKHTFSSIAIVFLGICLWEGWRIPRAR